MELTRRGFGLAIVPFGLTVLRSAGRTPRWAFISDTHIPTDIEDEYRGFRPYENLKKAIGEVAAAKMDGAVICGDLARLKGQASDYANLQGLLAGLGEGFPIALALGNHDNRNNFLGVIGPQRGEQDVKGKHVTVIETGAVRFIVLDSLFQTDWIPGFLGRQQRSWLGQFLASAKPMPTLLFVHHNLNDDDNGLLDAPRLFDVVRPHRQVKAIVYGHTHTYRFQEAEGIHLINIPATGYNFMDDKPVGWVEAEFDTGSARFTLHVIGGNRQLDKQTDVIKWRPA